MHAATFATAPATRPAAALPRPAAPRYQDESQRIADILKLVSEAVPVQRRLVHAGDKVFQCGQPFATLYIANSGFFKAVSINADGDEQVTGLHFRGDWMGFEAIATGRHASDLVAMDTGEVWAVSYPQLLAACAQAPALLTVIHGEMSRVIGRDRDSMMSLCTLSADARVAEFLRNFAEELGRRGMRTDQITLRLTRAEIGNYLGMTLETVSRALSRMAKSGQIEFAGKGRRDIRIPRPEALGQAALPAASALQ